MIVLVNGAFGIGKTTVARTLVRRLPRAVLYDPEIAGIALQRAARLAGRRVDDFQDLRLWRRLTVAGVRVAGILSPVVIVPMAFSNLDYLREVRSGLARFEPRVLHFCLRAPVEVVYGRLQRRGAGANLTAWEYRRAAECCIAHESGEFGAHVLADARSPQEIADEILAAIRGYHPATASA